MKWVEENGGVKNLGELPHLNEEEKVRYKEQIKVREDRRKLRLSERELEGIEGNKLKKLEDEL